MGDIHDGALHWGDALEQRRQFGACCCGVPLELRLVLLEGGAMHAFCRLMAHRARRQQNRELVECRSPVHHCGSSATKKQSTCVKTLPIHSTQKRSRCCHNTHISSESAVLRSLPSCPAAMLLCQACVRQMRCRRSPRRRFQYPACPRLLRPELDPRTWPDCVLGLPGNQ